MEILCSDVRVLRAESLAFLGFPERTQVLPERPSSLSHFPLPTEEGITGYPPPSGSLGVKLWAKPWWLQPSLCVKTSTCTPCTATLFGQVNPVPWLLAFGHPSGLQSCLPGFEV